ncbi:NAD(P)H-dependent oxidoreductase [Sphingomonas canadensis]|uniref:NAD(P)H-dependent oxidoreductase n=1 Tax=Sphingomonas canadensis TaxID=1219257 RepID=A0ABW3HAH8_9SPHN|nr:NAD(P)H-dependent oxidoreductase [Sphingomonas canadensis]MCW3837317.1 NAD(P)H-dependent oxidoreductase [Sphingomonas canadensis]
MSERPAAADPSHLVIACHPEPHSFTMAVANTYCEAVEACGHRAEFRDLYRMQFDPVLKASERPGAPGFSVAPDVAAELALLADAAVIVLVYPIWFGTPPAMLKGYVERVLGSGMTYRAIRGGEGTPLVAGKQLLSITSSGTTSQWLEEKGAWLSLRNVFDHYLRDAFALASDEHLHFSAIVEGLAERFVNENLEDVRQQARKTCSRVRRRYPTHRLE